MTRQSLASALSNVLKQREPDCAARSNAASLLLTAIKNSTTSMDQIVQRRIGLDGRRLKDLK